MTYIYSESDWPWSFTISGLLKPEKINEPCRPNGDTPLMLVIFNHFDLLQPILDLGADVTVARTSDGLTPLMALSMDFSPQKEERNIPYWIEEFIRRGANLHARTILNPEDPDGSMGFTALMVSVSHQSSVAFQKLLEMGADPDEKDNRGYTLREILEESFKSRGKTQGGMDIFSLLEAYQFKRFLPSSLKSKGKSTKKYFL